MRFGGKVHSFPIQPQTTVEALSSKIRADLYGVKSVQFFMADGCPLSKSTTFLSL